MVQSFVKIPTEAMNVSGKQQINKKAINIKLRFLPQSQDVIKKACDVNKHKQA